VVQPAKQGGEGEQQRGKVEERDQTIFPEGTSAEPEQRFPPDKVAQHKP
jgi:hypothetical protein